MIDDLLSEFVVDFSVDNEQVVKNKEETVFEVKEEDSSKMTRLQIVNINGEIVDA